MRTFLFLLIFLLSGVEAYPEDGASLEMLLRSQSALMEFSDQVDQEIEKKGFVGDELLAQMMRDTTQKFLAQYEGVKKKPSIARRLWDRISKLNWQALVEKTKGLGKKTAKIGKKHGISVASATILGTAMEFAVPLTLTHFGLGDYMWMSFATPYQPILIWPAKKVEQWWDDRKLAPIFGGKEELNAYRESLKEARRELHLGKMDDILLPIVTGENGKLAVISKSGHTAKLLSFLGVREKKITLSSVEKFYQKHLPNSKLPLALSQMEAASPTLKTAILVNHLYEQSPEAVAAFQRQFKKSILDVSLERGAGNREVLEWAEGFITIRDKAKLRVHMEQMPTQGMSKRMVGLWMRLILPHVLENIDDLSYRESQILRKRFGPLLAEAGRGQPVAFDASWKSKFLNYVNEAFTPAARPKPLFCASVLMKLTIK